MEFGDLWKIGVGTILSLFVLVGLFRFKNALRRRLFPTPEGKARGKAMAELLLLQARLQGEVENPPGTQNGVGNGVGEPGQDPVE